MRADQILQQLCEEDESPRDERQELVIGQHILELCRAVSKEHNSPYIQSISELAQELVSMHQKAPVEAETPLPSIKGKSWAQRMDQHGIPTGD